MKSVSAAEELDLERPKQGKKHKYSLWDVGRVSAGVCWSEKVFLVLVSSLGPA